MVFQRALPDGGTLHASEPTPIESVTALAEAPAALAWLVIDAGDTLHLHLAPDTGLPSGLGTPGLLWDLAASLTGPLTASLAVASGKALDAAAVLAPLGGAAATEAAALARMPVPALEDGPEAVWDRLAHAARRAQSLIRESRLTAAALSYRGRGRLIGPLTGDRLIRFGVSAWR